MSQVGERKGRKVQYIVTENINPKETIVGGKSYPNAAV